MEVKNQNEYSSNIIKYAKLLSSNPQDIHKIPAEYQTQELWIEVTKNNSYLINKVPVEYQTQEFWDEFAKNNQWDVYKVPAEYQTQEFWIKYVKNYLNGISDVPAEYQTHEMWIEYAKKNPFLIEKVPVRFKTEKLYYECVAKNPFYKESIKRGFYYSNDYVPAEYQTQEFWNKFVKQNPQDVHKVPVKYQTQELWDEFVKGDAIKAYKVPAKYQTQEMWNEYEKKAKPAPVKDIPLRYQTQEMWNRFAEEANEFPGLIKIVPEKFRSGFERMLYNEKLSSEERLSSIHSTENEKVEETKVSEAKIVNEERKVEDGTQGIKPVEKQEENEVTNSSSKTGKDAKAKEETLRQKFKIDNEEDFENLLIHYAQVNKNYYSNGEKHTEEEIKRRRNINAQFKRILNNKAKTMPQSENGEEFSSVLSRIDNGTMFSESELKEVAENKNACLKLFGIMASGVYDKGGQKVRISQKQRIALASTLERISSLRLEMNNSKKQAKTDSANKVENAKNSMLGDE